MGIFATTRPNFNYFDNSHIYDATIKIFILLARLILHLFLSINTLICPINCNSHQINCILKVFYNIYIICICMHIVHIMNLKINIWILKFLFKSENCYFNCLKHYLNLNFFIWIRYFNLNSKRLIWFTYWYLSSKLIFLNPRINISIQKIIIIKLDILILNIFILIWNFIFQLWKFCI